MRTILTICLLLCVTSVLGDDSWKGVWKFTPKDFNEKCCYLGRDVHVIKQREDSDKLFFEIPVVLDGVDGPCRTLEVHSHYNQLREPVYPKMQFTKEKFHFDLELNGETATFKSLQDDVECKGELKHTHHEKWDGVWNVEPVSTDEKCCFFDKAILVQDRPETIEEDVLISAYFAKTDACKKIDAQKNEHTQFSPVNHKFLEFDYNNGQDKWSMIQTGDGNGELKHKVDGVECVAKLKLNKEAVKFEGAYKLTEKRESSACCPKETLHVKKEGDEIDIKGEWKDNAFCQKFDLKGPFEKKVKPVFNTLKAEIIPADKTSDGVARSMVLRKWPQIIDLSFNEGAELCELVATEIKDDPQQPTGGDGKQEPSKGGEDPKKEEGGNAVWWVLGVLLVAALAAGAGWYVYKQREAKKLEEALLTNNA